MSETRYLNERQVSKLTSIGIQTLRNWRHTGKGPRYLKPAGLRIVRYRESDVHEFMNSQGGPKDQ